jgi:hypothetical protein
LQVLKVDLDLVEDPPRPRPVRWQEAAAVLEPAMRAARHGAEDVEIRDQRLRR